jgi:RND family efflux transporter MFP subunit
MGERKDDLAAASVRQRKIRRQKIISVAVVLVLIVAAAFIVVNKSKKKDELGAMVTAQAEVTTITQKISATGQVNAQTGAQVNIGSQLTGRIKHLFADVGSQVRAGQIIAELDLPDVKAQLDQQVANQNASQLKLLEQQSGVGLQMTTTSSGIKEAKAGLQSAEVAYRQAQKNASLEVNAAIASVNQAKASVKNDMASLKRNQQLLAKGYVAQQDVDNAQTLYDVAAAQLDSAQQNLNLVRIKAHDDIVTAQNSLTSAKAAMASALANTASNTIKLQTVAEAKAELKQAKYQVDYANAEFDKTLIRTPISGTVTTLAAQQGETVAAGLAAPTLITVVDLKRLQVDAYVDETDIGNVRLGQIAMVTVDAYPNRKFRGKVVKIASAATVQQNVVTYDTTIALENPEGLLKPGMTSTVDIMVGNREDVVAVPIEAVKSTKRGQVVYVLEGKKVVAHPVTVGISDDTVSEIVSGLKEGDTVVLAGYQPKPQQTTGSSTPFGGMGGGRGGR